MRYTGDSTSWARLPLVRPSFLVTVLCLICQGHVYSGNSLAGTEAASEGSLPARLDLKTEGTSQARLARYEKNLESLDPVALDPEYLGLSDPCPYIRAAMLFHCYLNVDVQRSDQYRLALHWMCQDRHWHVRNLALQVLGRLDGQPSSLIVAGALYDESERVRLSALDVMSKHMLTNSVPEIFELLKRETNGAGVNLCAATAMSTLAELTGKGADKVDTREHAQWWIKSWQVENEKER
ncbi:MAG: hypothetical protein ACI9OU_001690 [Candidatus Promineifilaceae bacterium]|jgi:hypothetical protein